MFRMLSAAALFVSLSVPAVSALSAPAAVASDATVVTPDDARSAQQVVRAQLAAFAADDADRAFSYASAGIQKMFGSAARFMAMVRGSYPAVYRPAAVVFLNPEAADGELVQPVHMTDQAGRTWLALYRLERQGDTGWRIGGCVLVPRAGQTV